MIAKLDLESDKEKLLGMKPAGKKASDESGKKGLGDTNKKKGVKKVSKK